MHFHIVPINSQFINMHFPYGFPRGTFINICHYYHPKKSCKGLQKEANIDYADFAMLAFIVIEIVTVALLM